MHKLQFALTIKDVMPHSLCIIVLYLSTSKTLNGHIEWDNGGYSSSVSLSSQYCPANAYFQSTV